MIIATVVIAILTALCVCAAFCVYFCLYTCYACVTGKFCRDGFIATMEQMGVSEGLLCSYIDKVHCVVHALQHILDDDKPSGNAQEEVNDKEQQQNEQSV